MIISIKIRGKPLGSQILSPPPPTPLDILVERPADLLQRKMAFTEVKKTVLGHRYRIFLFSCESPFFYIFWKNRFNELESCFFSGDGKKN